MMRTLPKFSRIQSRINHSVMKLSLLLGILLISLSDVSSLAAQQRDEIDLHGRELINSFGKRVNYSKSELQNLDSKLLSSSKTVNQKSASSIIFKDTIQLDLKILYSVIGKTIGRKSMHSLDIDADDVLDLICTGSTKSFTTGKFWYVMNFDPVDNAYKQTWVSSEYENGISVLEVIDANNDGNYTIILGFLNGTIHVYDANSKELLNESNPANEGIKSIVYGDADNDGQNEIVISTSGKSYLLNSTSMEVEFEIEKGAEEVRVGNVNDNDLNEIILSSGKVYSLKDDELSTVWEFSSTSDGIVELSDLDQDGMLEIIFAESWENIHVFDVDTKSTKQLIKADLDIHSLLVTDVDGDGIDEIIYGDGQWGEVHCHNLVSQKKMWSVNNPDHGVSAINFADLDNDGTEELIWGAGWTSTGEDHLYVYDVNRNVQEWKSTDMNGPFHAIAIGDVDGDAQEDIVAVSYSSNSGAGIIAIIDAKSKKIKWQSSGDFLYGIWTCVYDVAIHDVDKDGLNEIIIAAGQSYDGAVWIINGKEHSVESLYEYSSNNLDEFYTLCVEDINEDGVVEIIASTETDVCVINPLDGQLEWTVTFSANLYKTPIVNCADITGDGKKEIVYCNGSIRIINSIDHSVWTSTETNFLNFTFIDYNKDGVSDIAASNFEGEIVILDGDTKTQIAKIDAEINPITSLKVLPYGDTFLFIYSNSGRLNHYINDEKRTVSQYLGSEVADVRGIQIMENSDMLLGTSYSVLQLSEKSMHCAGMEINIDKMIASCGINDGRIELNLSGGSAPYEVTWEGQSGLTYLENLAPGIYNVKVADNGGCEKKREIEIEEAYIEANMKVVNEGCLQKGSVTANIIHSTPPNSIEWSNNRIGLVNNSLVAGTYTIKIVDSKHCVYEETVEVEKNDVLINPIVQDVACYDGWDGRIQLKKISGTEPIDYEWSTGSSDAEIYSLTAGVYSVKVKDALGCSTNLEVEVKQPDKIIYSIQTSPDVDETPNWEGKIIISNISGGVSPYSVFWPDFKVYDHYLDVLPNGSYNFVLSDGNDCLIYDKAVLEPIVTGIEETSERNFRLYPNPASDKLNIQMDGNIKLEEIALINTSGQLIWRLTEYSNQQSIDLSELDSGVYILRLTSKNSINYQKFIKK
jgi:hypothetical protein